MSNLCETHERSLGRLSLETHIYEDGYIRSTLIDEFGLEIASLDGNSRHHGESYTRALIEEYLIDQYYREETS